MKKILIMLFLLFANQVSAQYSNRLVAFEIAPPFTFGGGYANSKSTTPALSHLLENSKKRCGVYEYLNTRLIFAKRYFISFNIDGIGYKFSRAKSIETLQLANPNFAVSRQSKYGYSTIDESTQNSSSTNLKLGIGYQHPIHDSLYLESYVGYLRSRYSPSSGLYAFKDPNSNQFYVHEFLMPKAAGRGWFAGIGIKKLAVEKSESGFRAMYVSARIEMSQFTAKGTGTEVITDIYENKVEVPLTYQVKTTTIIGIIGIGLIL
jgi:hypothetical protein